MHSLSIPLNWPDVVVAASMFLAYLLFDILAKQQKHRRARILVAALALATACVAVTVIWPLVVVGWQP